MRKYILISCVSIISIVLLAAYSHKTLLAQNDKISSAPEDVLIIYSHGTPHKTISDMKFEDIDGITTATPSDVNTKTIAEQIEVMFRFRGYKTRLVSTEEIKSYKEILNHPMVLFGTGVRFWNMSWEMKKLIDVHLGNIYIAHKTEFNKQTIGAFAQAEIPESADAAIKTMQSAIGDCSNSIVAYGIFLTSNNMPNDTLVSRIKKLVDVMELQYKIKKSQSSD